VAEQHHDDDLLPSTTEGYKLGDKKTIDEYAKLDSADDSLNRWKASLGIGKGVPLTVPPHDKRTVVICQLVLVVPGRDDFVVDVEDPGKLEDLRKHPICIKEDSPYRLKVRFRVQHEIISGLKYLRQVKRGIISDKAEEMMGSYAPNTHDQPIYEKTFAQEVSPSGLMARGTYQVHTRFVDDDKHVHQKFDWSFEIKKTWD